MTQQPKKQNKIGNYILGKTIGQGTFGKVKLAIHTLTQQKVAVKILVKSKIIDVADVERVSREIHILKLIRHPSIIQLYEIIETTKHLFLIMQYVEKGELFDYIVKQAKLQEKEACKFFKHIISGIAYIHELNIVHRDLKPQNLLIDWKHTLKIVDFGLSNTYKPGELLKTACGSPCYAAPEMISNKKYSGLEVDIWSSGVILFAMVCGYLPFQDNNTAELYKKILSGEYVLPDFASSAFKDLIEKILNVNPSKRYGLQQIYRHQWCNLIDDIPLKSGIVVGYHRIPVDKQILSMLKQFDYDLQYSQRCIESNKHNHITTAYYLLLKKQGKLGYHSESDVNSMSFNYAAIEPFKRVVNTQKKYYFFGGKEESPLIKLQNIDISINKNKDANLALKPQTTKFQFKKPQKFHHFSSSELQKSLQKSKKISVQQINGSKKFKDLDMYLKKDQFRKNDYYSTESKQRQNRRHIQSLYEQRTRFKGQSNNRTQTEYSEQKVSSISKGKLAVNSQKKRLTKLNMDKLK